MKPQSRFTCIALFAIVLFFLTAPAVGQQTSTPDVLSQFSESLLALTEKVAPAVVEIQVVGYGPDKDDDVAKADLYKQHATGSGVILGSDGYIITNAHVIKGAKHIRVVLNNTTDSKVPAGIIQDAVTRFDAVVVGAHEDMDLAVLKIQATGLPTIVLADSADLRQGQVVIAVGNPMGMRSSVSQGVVSAVARQRSEDKPMVLIQTDALVSPGSSGGALVDTKGGLSASSVRPCPGTGWGLRSLVMR